MSGKQHWLEYLINDKAMASYKKSFLITCRTCTHSEKLPKKIDRGSKRGKANLLKIRLRFATAKVGKSPGGISEHRQLGVLI